MKRTVIRNVAVLDAAAVRGLSENYTVVVHGSSIESVASSDEDAPLLESGSTVIDGTGMLLAPGLVNAHTHSQSSTLSGFGDSLSHPAFMWLTQAHTSRRTKDEIRLAVLLTAYGLMSSGTTSVIDHFPGQRFSEEDVDAVLEAWEETGLRATVALRFFDGDFSDIMPSGLSDALLAQLREVELLKPQVLDSVSELTTHAVRKWHGKGGRLAVFPAPSNPDRCSDAALLFCADIAERYDLGIHTHLLETERQRAIAMTRYGVSTVAHLERLGILSDRWSCAHSIWLNEADMELMAMRGAIAVLNPESNARLGTGLAAIPDLRRHGVALALGSDGAGSNDNMVMQEAMRSIATAHRAGQPDRSQWLTARTALEICVEGGAMALRCGGLGRIRAGAPADLVLYRMDQPWWIPVNDAVAQLVFAETGASVDTVICAGEILFANGRPTRFDPRELKREINAMAQKLRIRNADLFEVAERFASHP